MNVAAKVVRRSGAPLDLDQPVGDSGLRIYSDQVMSARKPCSDGALAAALTAAVLGIGSAALSAWWALGGTALLDTVGGEVEQWGRQRSLGVVVALWSIAVLKAGVGLAAPVLVLRPSRLPPWTTESITRALGWIAAAVLTIYGGVLTAVGLLVQCGIITASSDSDHRALAWHAYLWDPWFLAWGVAFLTCLWLTRLHRVGDDHSSVAQ